MIVLDASAAYLGLVKSGETRSRMRGDAITSPHHVDVELASALRARSFEGAISAALAQDAVERWMVLGIRRRPTTALLPRIWELRDNLTPYDAGYVALAEALKCDLVTADGRLARAPGPRCTIRVVKT